MTAYELERQALESKHARAQIIDPLFTRMGKRPRGEAGALSKLITEVHELLCEYDVQENPPSMSGASETMFEAAVARLTELLDQRDAAEAEREAKKAAAAK
jgi:uncharacterized protein YqgV (UPF0045/DUF77 family)